MAVEEYISTATIRIPRLLLGQKWQKILWKCRLVLMLAQQQPIDLTDWAECPAR